MSKEQSRQFLSEVLKHPLRTITALGSAVALTCALSGDYTVSAQDVGPLKPLSPIATASLPETVTPTGTPTPGEVEGAAVVEQQVICCYWVIPVALNNAMNPAPTATPNLGLNTFWEYGDRRLNCEEMYDPKCEAILFWGITTDNCSAPILLHLDHSTIDLSLPFPGTKTFQEYNDFFGDPVVEALHVHDTGTVLVLTDAVGNFYKIHWDQADDFRLVMTCSSDDTSQVQSTGHLIPQITEQQLKDLYGIDMAEVSNSSPNSQIDSATPTASQP